MVGCMGAKTGLTPSNLHIQESFLFFCAQLTKERMAADDKPPPIATYRNLHPIVDLVFDALTLEDVARFRLAAAREAVEQWDGAWTRRWRRERDGRLERHVAKKSALPPGVCAYADCEKMRTMTVNLFWLGRALETLKSQPRRILQHSAYCAEHHRDVRELQLAAGPAPFAIPSPINDDGRASARLAPPAAASE